jgi:hypothetical protein
VRLVPAIAGNTDQRAGKRGVQRETVPEFVVFPVGRKTSLKGPAPAANIDPTGARPRKQARSVSTEKAEDVEEDDNGNRYTC